MKEFRIFTEGPSDVRFLRDYIAERFEVNLSVSDHFDTLGSCFAYKTDGILKQSIRLAHDDRKHIILVLDADDDFTTRQAKVLGDFQGFNVTPHIFLFPNNKAKGNLEVLLSHIATKRKLIDCFGAYQKCIEGYQLPDDNKARIFAYLEALLPSANTEGGHKDLIQPQNRNYRNRDHWDLHHAYLQPLHDFLSPFFIETT